jgi:uncharacterized membrane protein YphA (DoxX/SURF4 family)
VVVQHLGYLLGLILTLAGAAIIFNKYTRVVSLCLGVLLLLFLLFGHLPNRLKYHPELIGYWTDAIKLLALSGGAFILAGIAQEDERFTAPKKLIILARYGKYFYALMLLIFGAGHFHSADFIKSLVPGWVPYPLFWTYLTGVALIGAGTSIVINFKVALVSFLLAIMFLLWLLMLHLPATLKYPFAEGNLAISSSQTLAFSGIALLLAALGIKQQVLNKSDS